MQFSTTNPATGKKIKEYKLISNEDALQIAKSTYQSQKEWHSLNLNERLEHIKKLAEVLRNNKQEYAELMTTEMGKVITESLAEIEKCAVLCDVLVEKSREWLKEELIEADGKKHLITFEPLGTVFMVMPWNYPFWQVFKVGLPPLVAGNSLLLKHARNVTGCSLAIEDAFKQAGFPLNVFRSIIIGHETSTNLIESDYVQAVSVTGSVGAGASIASDAGKNIKKIVLELGGSDPFIVLEDADIKKAAMGAAYGRTSNAGQVCIGSKRFIVHKNVAEAFSTLFAKFVSEKVVGDPLDIKSQIGPLVDLTAVKEMEDFVNDAVSNGAKILCGGARKEPGCYFLPTVLSNTTGDMRVVSEETFGPVAPIIIVNTDEEAIKIANNSEFGLSASVWTENLEEGEKVARKLNTGSVFINSTSKSHPMLPIGGIKKSGYGRELSHYGIKEFVNIKTINIYSSGDRA
jgi:succinate-semialdehyde dehydrogenase / glutarate-semialdehyde dehydrogenase